MSEQLCGPICWLRLNHNTAVLIYHLKRVVEMSALKLLRKENTWYDCVTPKKSVSVHALEDAQNGPTSRVLLLSSIHGGKILVMFNSTSDPDGDGGPCLYIKFHSIRRDQNLKGIRSLKFSMYFDNFILIFWFCVELGQIMLIFFPSLLLALITQTQKLQFFKYHL